MRYLVRVVDRRTAVPAHTFGPYRFYFQAWLICLLVALFAPGYIAIITEG